MTLLRGVQGFCLKGICVDRGGGRADNKCIYPLAMQPFFSRELGKDEACLGYGRGAGIEERCSGIGEMDGDRNNPAGEQKVLQAGAATGSSVGAPLESLRVRIEWSPSSQDRGPSAICRLQLHGAEAKCLHGNIHG